jgi:hypothetical protein
MGIVGFYGKRNPGHYSSVYRIAAGYCGATILKVLACLKASAIYV